MNFQSKRILSKNYASLHIEFTINKEMFFSGKSVPELISLHIPKTAGTSFRNILKSVYGEEQVVRFDINEKGEVRLNEEIYSKNILPSVKVIHGHFIYNTLTEKFALPENFKIITWVRDPVKRVISNYFYLESRLRQILDEENKNLNILSKLQRSLIEYARADLNRNRQAKFLNGRPLKSFDFVGIQEFFDMEVSRLSNVLKWKKNPEVLFHNLTPLRDSNIDPDLLNEIRELNMEDVKIYNEALQIRNSLINK